VALLPILAIAAGPVYAGQAAADLTPLDWLPGSVAPTEAGKPAIVPPYALSPASDDERCLPSLPCGTRLLGTVRRNGAIELEMPAWRW